MSTLRYINGRIKNRRDTKDDWSKDNPLLYDGELALEQDTNKLKMGDGITRWNDLPYISAGLPTGSVIAFSGETIPDDWLLCNGAAIDRTEYANLFSVIGTKFGNGNGSNTFNLPNLAKRYIMGAEDESTLDTVVEAGLPNLSGQFFVRASGNWDTNLSWADKDPTGPFYRQPNPQSCQNWDYNRGQWISAISYIGFDASRASPIYGRSDTVQPPSILMYYIIKV